MVELVEDWGDLREYSEWCRYGVYQVNDGPDGVQVRVRVGRFGYSKTFNENDKKEKELYDSILAFCRGNRFIKVLDSIADDRFFSTMIPYE